MHNNVVLHNNSVVLREEIGEGDKALCCQTLTDEECGSSYSPQIFFPNKTQILLFDSGLTVYSTNGTGSVHLNRKDSDESPLGVYYCQMQDSKGNLQTIFIKIGMQL